LRTVRLADGVDEAGQGACGGFQLRDGEFVDCGLGGKYMDGTV
jgi:hypothetical protein